MAWSPLWTPFDPQILFYAYALIYTQNNPRPVSFEEFITYKNKSKHKLPPMTDDDFKLLLESQPFIQKTEDGYYTLREMTYFKSIFSIVPSRKEIEEGFLIIGHRAEPFLNPLVAPVPGEVKLFYKEEEIPVKTIKTKIFDIQKYFSLFNENEFFHYMCCDPAVENPDEISYYENTSVKLSVFDMKDFYKRANFHFGDRLICAFKNWGDGEISIADTSDSAHTTELANYLLDLRKAWFKTVEESFLKYFDKKVFASSIRQQLYEALSPNIKKISLPFAPSIDEFLQYSQKVGIEQCGIESRLWKKNEPIIFFSSWDQIFSCVKPITFNFEQYGFYKCLGLKIQDEMIEAFILDELYFEENHIAQKIIERIIPEFLNVSSDDVEAIKLKLGRKSAKIRRSYNKFADHMIAEVRHVFLDLYSQLISLVFEIKLSGIDVSTMSQQPLFMIMQLIEHITATVILNFNSDGLTTDTVQIMSDSFEGMQMCFMENSDEIMKALRKAHSNLHFSSDLESENGK